MGLPRARRRLERAAVPQCPGPAMGDVKNYLYAWCGKRRVMPAYEIRSAGGRGRQTFLCEVRACPAGERAGRALGDLEL